jgi:predicted lipoprotein
MNMNRKAIVPALILGIAAFSSCSKSSDNGGTTTPFTTVETQVTTSFVNSTAIPQYDSLSKAGTALNTAINNLVATPTDANLQTAQTAWKKMRLFWERTEGFLIGPVEEQDYDPNTDTWPTDYQQMDALLAGSNPLNLSDVQSLDPTLRGYHPIEYLIFGKGGSRKASELDARKIKYLTSLTADLEANVQALHDSWTTGGASSYAQKILTAGAGNTTYASKQAFFLVLAGAVADICNEVGQQNEDGKMYNPFSTKDSSLAESPYSGNSLIDFKNNIIGAQQVYLGYNGGKGIKDLVAAKNKDLDAKIQAAITAAVNSFDNISGADNMRFEVAITQRRTQIQTTMDLLNTLQALLENDLVNFIKTNVKD